MEQLKEEFHVPVEIIDPFRKVKVDPEKFDTGLPPRYCSLPVRGSGAGAEELRLVMIKINLLGVAGAGAHGSVWRAGEPVGSSWEPSPAPCVVCFGIVGLLYKIWSSVD